MGGGGGGSVPSLPPGQTIWNPWTTGSGPRRLRREGGKCILGVKDADERQGGVGGGVQEREIMETRQRGERDLTMVKEDKRGR